MKRLDQAGTSLVEILTVVAIIGILSAIGMADYARFGIRAKYMRAKSEMVAFATIIHGSKMADEMFAWQITGNSCTGCGGDPTASWRALGEQQVPRDPWGMPYILDENENEFDPDCRNDWLFTSGYDRNFAGLVDPPQGDDLLVRVPQYANHPDCPGLDLYGVGPDYRW